MMEGFSPTPADLSTPPAPVASPQSFLCALPACSAVSIFAAGKKN
jgi:hypothetical protein